MNIELLILDILLIGTFIIFPFLSFIFDTKIYDQEVKSYIDEFAKDCKEENKSLFTEEDVRNAIEKARIYHIDSVSTDDIIQDLKQSKTK